MKRRSFLALLLMQLPASAGFCSSLNPDFSGTWELSGERSTPKRTGKATLHIDHRDPQLTVETTMFRGAGEPRHAVQRYSTDGRTTVSTGADGDEFHTSIVWAGESLVFSIEEHEDGRILPSRERWTLIEGGTALERVREDSQASLTGSEIKILIYLRKAPQT